MKPFVTCKKPDHDNPKLICGYPLPCPWHTAILTPGNPPRIEHPGAVPLPRRTARRLAEIGKVLEPKG